MKGWNGGSECKNRPSLTDIVLAEQLHPHHSEYEDNNAQYKC